MAILDGLRQHLQTWGENVATNAADIVEDQTARDAPYDYGQRVSVSAVSSSGDSFSTIITVDIEPFEWVHNAPAVPFPAHEELPFMGQDGGPEFYGEDDPRLSVELGFPTVAFYTPGDHAGCLCQTFPTDGSIANPWFQDPLPDRWQDALQQAAGQES